MAVETSGTATPDKLTKPKKGIRLPIPTSLAARLAFASLTVAGTGGGLIELTPIHGEVNDEVAGWWNSITKPVGDFFTAPSLEERFPIALPREGFTPVTPEEERLLWEGTKTVDLENHTFTIGFPVNQATIDKSPNLRMNQEFGTYTFTPTEKEKLQKQGFKTGTQISGFPKDAEIYYRYDATKFDASIIKIAIAGEIQEEGSNSFNPAYTTLRIILIGKTTGKQYDGGIAVLYGKPLVNPAPFPTDHHPVYEDGTPIKPDEPILQLTTDLQDWDGKTGQVLPGQKGQVVIASAGGGYVSVGDAISDAQRGIFNPDYYLTTSFLTNPNTNTIATKR